MKITDATFPLVSAICPVDGIADMGDMADDAAREASARWPDAEWKTWADRSIWRLDVSADATPDQRAALREFLLTFDAPPEDIVRRLVPKSIIVDRLHAAGKLDAAFAALNVADLYTRQRWETRSAIYSDDPTAVALIRAIGADPAVILAAE